MSDYERQLLKSAGKGNVAAFEELIGPHQNRVYNFMLKESRNEFEASILAQEVFIKVFENLISQKNPVGFVSSIYKTAAQVSRKAVFASKKIS